MNPGLIILLAAGLFLMMNKSTTAPTPTGNPVTALTTDQKRRAIIVWWETSTPPLDQTQDNGYFEEIITNVSPGEIDTIYSYVTNYVQQGTRPPVGSVLYNQMQAIINYYKIFT